VINAASFTAQDQKNLAALVQSQQGAESDDEELGAPAAAVYKTHSSSIFDVLEDMKEKAEGQLTELRKAEMNAKHNYDMLKQSLTDSMAADSKEMQETKSAKSNAEENKAVAEGDLAVTKKDLADAQAVLAGMSQSCSPLHRRFVVSGGLHAGLAHTSKHCLCVCKIFFRHGEIALSDSFVFFCVRFGRFCFLHFLGICSHRVCKRLLEHVVVMLCVHFCLSQLSKLTLCLLFHIFQNIHD
jgi:hypothetical protein